MNKKLGILLFDQVQAMDVIGPWEVFSFWKNNVNPDLDMMLIAEHHGLVYCENQIILKAHTSIEHAPQLDYLIVPGGPGRRHYLDPKHPLIQFINKQFAQLEYLASVCTGMFLLQTAGLLEGKTVTTYWRAHNELNSFPNLKLAESRIVHDGKIWMSGGVSSGIDLALAMIAHLAGEHSAGQVQLLFEYFPSTKIYCAPNDINQIPLYPGSKQHAKLPTYIKSYIDQHA